MSNETITVKFDRGSVEFEKDLDAIVDTVLSPSNLKRVIEQAILKELEQAFLAKVHCWFVKPCQFSLKVE